MADWLLYEHDDGRHAVAPSAEAATFAKNDPAWHRVGPVEVPDGFARALQIVKAEIGRAEALLNVEDGGVPVFDRAQTESGIAALRTVAAAVEREASGVMGRPALDLSDVPVPQENSWQRPSRDGYEKLIADTQEAEDKAGGVLAAGGTSGVLGTSQIEEKKHG